MKILLTDNYQGDSLVVFEHKPISKEKLNIVCRTIETGLLSGVVVANTFLVGGLGLVISSIAICFGFLISKMMEI